MALKTLFVAFTVDVLLLLALGLYFLYNKLAGNPTVRGFFCDDLTISYPAQSDSVSWVSCLLVAGFVPLPIIILSELIWRTGRGVETSVAGFGETLLAWIGPFVAGFFFEHMFVDIAKYNVGRLRPNFIDNCRPYFTIDGSVYDCQNTTKPSHFIADYQCVNHDYQESLLSFPSGHTSLITYAMVFAVGYLELRMPSPLLKASFLAKPMLQIGLLLVAWYISLSRISDYKHHWSDVLAGSIIGAFIALVALFYVIKWRGKPEATVSEATGLVNEHVTNDK